MSELTERMKQWFNIHPDTDLTLDEARVLINRKYTRNRGLFYECMGAQMLDDLIELTNTLNKSKT